MNHEDGADEADPPESNGEVAASDADSDSMEEPTADPSNGTAPTEDPRDVSDSTEADSETDTDVTDEEDAEGDDQSDRIDQLEEEIAEREDRIDELESRLKRVQADFQNYKKRMKRKQEEIREHATEDLVERLLDVRDDLKRALEADAGDVDDIREGVKMTLAELDRVLDAEGVSGIEPDPGDEIDPTKHEVMLRIDGDNPEDTIEDVYNQGYEMGSKVLRPAQVTVSNGAGADDSAGGTDGSDTQDAADDGEHDQRE